MRLEYWWQDWNMEELLEGYLPDFVLAFTFFTSIVYVVLGKRFEQQRPAVTMSAAIGLALSLGLVRWEQTNDFSIKNLGPIAVGFAILLLAFVMYQCIRQIGGSWAGAGITLGASILVARLLGLNVPIDGEIIQTIATVGLIIGLMAFYDHRGPNSSHHPLSKPILPDVKNTMADLFRNRHLSRRLDRGLRTVRKEAATLHEHPEQAKNILFQIKRMLPVQGHLTERMAQLRAKAHQTRNGHIARLEETRQAFSELPASTRKKASGELAAAYNQVVGIDMRMERLDKSVAENEQRIRELTAKAREYTAKYDYQRLTEVLKAAQKLQHHNSKLIKTIELTENKLSTVARKVAKKVKQNDK